MRADTYAPAVTAVLTEGRGVIVLYVSCSRRLKLWHISRIELHVGFKRLGNIGHECGPIVHLNVYVVPDTASPRSVVVSVPDSLQVCGKRTRAGGSDQEVSSVLEVQHFKIGAVFTLLISLQKLVGGNACVLRVPKVKGNSAEHFGIIRKVVVLQDRVALLEALALKLSLDRGKLAPYLLHSIGKIGVEGGLFLLGGGEYLGGQLVVRAESDIYISAFCAGNGNSAVGISVLVYTFGSGNDSAVGDNAVKTREVNVVISHLTAESDLTDTVFHGGDHSTRLGCSVPLKSGVLLLPRYGGAKSKAECALLGGIQTDNESLVGIGGEILSRVGDAVITVGHARDSSLQIKISLVFADLGIGVSKVNVGLGKIIETSNSLLIALGIVDPVGV